MRQGRARSAYTAEVRKYQSISVRLTVFALLISIFPLLFVSGLLMRRLERMTESELQQSYQWIINEYIGNVEDKLRFYEESVDRAARNTTIQASLADEGGNAYALGNAISNEVFKMVSMENRREVHECLIYATGPAQAFGTRVKVFSELDRTQWLTRGWNGGDDRFFTTTWDGQRTLSVVRSIDFVDVDRIHAQKVGFIRLELYLEGLFEPAFDSSDDYHIVLTDAAGERLYASSDEAGRLHEMWKTELQDDGISSLDAYTVLKNEIDEYGLELLFLFDNNALILQKSRIKQSIYPTALLLSALIVLLARIYFTGFSRRVGQLLEKFRMAGAGDLSLTAPIRGNDEITVLDRRFGQMLQDMDEMNRRSLEQENVIREAKYRNLQLQINPHFLYNTLETISAIGAMHGVMQVCDLCQKLGDIFRYSLGKNEGKYTSVERELQQIRNYIFIQQVRHKFEVFYSIDVDAGEVYMLRFLLQPIVENAVQHGLMKNGQTGTLEVCVGERDGDLEISIGDDGVGMTEEELEVLRCRLLESTDQRENVSNIGVWNISQRIRLSYGEPYGITVQSKPGMGSLFILRLPMITKGMIENDEIPSVDRG